MSDTPDSAVRTYIDQHRGRRRSAGRPAVTFRGTGFPVTGILDAPGAPAVLAAWPSGEEKAPTVLVQGHHDVQPAAVGDMYGRGAHLWSELAAQRSAVMPPRT